jgi:hypothetical protein
MTTEQLEDFLSKARLSSYYDLFQDDKTKAIEYYRLNSEISETYYILLSNLEIGLRNKINQSFTKRYNDSFWFDKLQYAELIQMVKLAKSKIEKSEYETSSNKIIAELTLGFWTALFNRQYAKDLWKPLMHSFPNIKKDELHRDKIAQKLNQIRKFRNRIFHYEPICNDLTALKKNTEAIIEILNWLNKDIYQWTRVKDKLEDQFERLTRFRMTS